MIEPSKYLLTARDPETYVALAVDDLLSRTDGAVLHLAGDLTVEYLGMLSLYAIRQASMMFTEGMPYYRLIKHAREAFDPDNMSDKLICCLRDILYSMNQTTAENTDPSPSFNGFQLSSSTQNSLVSSGIHTVADIINMSIRELNIIRNLGDAVTDELAAELYRQGYKSKAVELAFPGSTVKDIEKARNNPNSVLYLDFENHLGNRLYRNGVKSLSDLKNMSVDELAELKGISYHDIMEINDAIADIS